MGCSDTKIYCWLDDYSKKLLVTKNPFKKRNYSDKNKPLKLWNNSSSTKFKEISSGKEYSKTLIQKHFIDPKQCRVPLLKKQQCWFLKLYTIHLDELQLSLKTNELGVSPNVLYHQKRLSADGYWYQVMIQTPSD